MSSTQGREAKSVTTIPRQLQLEELQYLNEWIKVYNTRGYRLTGEVLID